MGPPVDRRAKLTRASAISLLLSGALFLLGLQLCGYQNTSGWGGPYAGQGVFALLASGASLVVGVVLAIAATVTPRAVVDPATGRVVAGPQPLPAPLLFYAGACMAGVSGFSLATSVLAFRGFFPVFTLLSALWLVASVLAVVVLVVAAQKRAPRRAGIAAGAWLALGLFTRTFGPFLIQIGGSRGVALVAAAVETALGALVLVEGLRMRAG